SCLYVATPRSDRSLPRASICHRTPRNGARLLIAGHRREARQECGTHDVRVVDGRLAIRDVAEATPRFRPLRRQHQHPRADAFGDRQVAWILELVEGLEKRLADQRAPD